LPHIDRVVRSVPRAAIIPWVANEPVGSERLLDLVRRGAGELASSSRR